MLQDIEPGSSTDAPLKREPQSDEDKVKQRVKAVTLLRTLQDQSNAIKVLLSESSENKFLSQLTGDLDAFFRKLVRVIKIAAERVTSPPARSDIQKLLKMVDKLHVECVLLKDA